MEGWEEFGLGGVILPSPIPISLLRLFGSFVASTLTLQYMRRVSTEWKMIKFCSYELPRSRYLLFSASGCIGHMDGAWPTTPATALAR